MCKFVALRHSRFALTVIAYCHVVCKYSVIKRKNINVLPSVFIKHNHLNIDIVYFYLLQDLRLWKLVNVLALHNIQYMNVLLLKMISTTILFQNHANVRH